VEKLIKGNIGASETLPAASMQVQAGSKSFWQQTILAI
jgi:hypothetical protein